MHEGIHDRHGGGGGVRSVFPPSSSYPGPYPAGTQRLTISLSTLRYGAWVVVGLILYTFMFPGSGPATPTPSHVPLPVDGMKAPELVRSEQGGGSTSGLVEGGGGVQVAGSLEDTDESCDPCSKDAVSRSCGLYHTELLCQDKVHEESVKRKAECLYLEEALKKRLEEGAAATLKAHQEESTRREGEAVEAALKKQREESKRKHEELAADLKAVKKEAASCATQLATAEKNLAAVEQRAVLAEKRVAELEAKGGEGGKPHVGGASGGGSSSSSTDSSVSGSVGGGDKHKGGSTSGSGVSSSSSGGGGGGGSGGSSTSSSGSNASNSASTGDKGGGAGSGGSKGEATKGESAKGGSSGSSDSSSSSSSSSGSTSSSSTSSSSKSGGGEGSAIRGGGGGTGSSSSSSGKGGAGSTAAASAPSGKLPPPPNYTIPLTPVLDTDPMFFDGPWDTLCPHQAGAGGWDARSETRCPSSMGTCGPNEFSPSLQACCPWPNATLCGHSSAGCCPGGTECVKASGHAIASRFYCVEKGTDRGVIGINQATCKAGPNFPMHPTLRNVVWMGDSISIGAFPAFARALSDVALVQHAPWGGNGGAEETAYGDACLHHFLHSPSGFPINPDLIIFNFGMHDGPLLNETLPGQYAPPDAYRANLAKITDRLQVYQSRRTPPVTGRGGGKLAWVDTTPYMCPKAMGGDNGCVQTLNNWAGELMGERGVPVLSAYSHIVGVCGAPPNEACMGKEGLRNWCPHASDEAYQSLGEFLAVGARKLLLE